MEGDNGGTASENPESNNRLSKHWHTVMDYLKENPDATLIAVREDEVFTLSRVLSSATGKDYVLTCTRGNSSFQYNSRDEIDHPKGKLRLDPESTAVILQFAREQEATSAIPDGGTFLPISEHVSTFVEETTSDLLPEIRPELDKLRDLFSKSPFRNNERTDNGSAFKLFWKREEEAEVVRDLMSKLQRHGLIQTTNGNYRTKKPHVSLSAERNTALKQLLRHAILEIADTIGCKTVTESFLDEIDRNGNEYTLLVLDSRSRGTRRHSDTDSCFIKQV